MQKQETSTSLFASDARGRKKICVAAVLDASTAQKSKHEVGHIRVHGFYHVLYSTGVWIHGKAGNLN